MMAMGAKPRTVQSPPDQAHADRLDRLAHALVRRGLHATLLVPPGRMASLHVVNPAVLALAEDIYAGRCEDGRWWFWWSWAERIAADDDLEAAASRIGHVLAAPRQPDHP
jgi:hypothetical protein